MLSDIFSTRAAGAGLSAAVAVIAFGLFSAGGALAATCSLGAEGKVLQDNTGYAATCSAGSTNNDFLGGVPALYQVNEDAMFTFTDWLFAGKQNTPGTYENGDVDVDFAISGGLQSGTWSFVSNLFDLYSDVMIVIKGGSGNNTQENYVGYLLNSSLWASGSYATPFFNLNNGNPKGISHITAYVRGTPAPIPVPAAGLLLVGALGGLAALRRRKTA